MGLALMGSPQMSRFLTEGLFGSTPVNPVPGRTFFPNHSICQNLLLLSVDPICPKPKAARRAPLPAPFQMARPVGEPFAAASGGPAAAEAAAPAPAPAFAWPTVVLSGVASPLPSERAPGACERSASAGPRRVASDRSPSPVPRPSEISRSLFSPFYESF